MSWKDKLLSRKFLMALAGAILMVCNEGLGLNLPDQIILPFVSLIIAYILGEAVIDAARAYGAARYGKPEK